MLKRNGATPETCAAVFRKGCAQKAGAARDQLKLYRDVISMWLAKFDTMEVGIELGLDECVVARWVANFRDVAAEAA